MRLHGSDFPTIFLLLALAAFLQADLVTITIIIALTAWMAAAHFRIHPAAPVSRIRH